MLIPLKVVIVGDEGVGKTCMLIRYTTGDFPVDYVPTVMDCFHEETHFQEEMIDFGLWDTCGEGYEGERYLCYANVDVIILTFCIGNPMTLQNIETRWIRELSTYCENIPIILVGTQEDLRTNPSHIEKLKSTNREPVTHSQGMNLAKQIHAKQYLECSSLTGDGIERVFVECMKIKFPSIENNRTIKD